MRRTIAGRPRDEAELAELVWRAFRLRIPDVQVCPNHSTPWRAFSDAFFAVSPVSVWKGSRGQAGKTFLLALLSVCEALLLKADVNLLGGSGGQSTLGLRYISEDLRKSNIVSGGLAGDPVAHEIRLQNGARIRALMASQTSVRGPHPVRLRLDEVDEMDMGILDAAMGQPMSRGDVKSQIVASSTHQYPDGTMTEILKRAGERGWPVHLWCYRETSAPPHGWLTLAEIEQKRAQVSAAMWSVEYDLQEPSTEGRAIIPEAVDRMFTADLSLQNCSMSLDSRLKRSFCSALYIRSWVKNFSRYAAKEMFFPLISLASENLNTPFDPESLNFSGSRVSRRK